MIDHITNRDLSTINNITGNSLSMIDRIASRSLIQVDFATFEIFLKCCYALDYYLYKYYLTRLPKIKIK